MSRHTTRRIFLVIFIIAAGLVYGWAFPDLSRAQARTAVDLPPRPTVAPTPPTPVPVSKAVRPSFIALATSFPATWPWASRHWQSLPTQVEWQTAEGDWAEVKGWYGAHDTIEVDDGVGTATKTWWVAAGDYGAGPFRWLVLAEDDATQLAVSHPFSLPVRSGQTVVVEVSLPSP